MQLLIYRGRGVLPHEAIRERVREVLRDGVEVEIYRAEEALFLFQEIASHLDQIKQNNWENLFGVFQQYCIATLILSLTKIFEVARRHDVRSLPWLIRDLQRTKEAPRAYPHVDDFDGLLVRWWAMVDGASAENNVTLERLKAVRDKRVAHSELIPDDEIEGPTWAQIETLLGHTKAILADMGGHLMKMSYFDDDGSYFLTADAKRASSALRRLLGLVVANR